MTTVKDKHSNSGTTDKSAPELEPGRQVSFAETAFRLAGKSEDEVKRTGAVDLADDQVEALFATRYKTSNSPVHRAVWDSQVPLDLFMTPRFDAKALLQNPVVKRCLEVIEAHNRAGTMHNAEGKVTEEVIADLGAAGYWGLFIPKRYGGQELSVRQFMNVLSVVGLTNPILSGLASVHSCIGAVDPIAIFGSEEQKTRYLPKLANGEMVSAFGLTEPNAGSDLTALRTTATLDGNVYLLNGEKLFITNAAPGRLACIVALVEGKPAVLIVELPKQESESFQFVKYGLYAVKRAYNQGLRFNNFPVPKENLLVPKVGDGLAVAYHGLNRGRLAVCATAAAGMKQMLANMIPWAEFRQTYGQPIVKRELVKRRIARTAALIAGAEALYNWGSWLLDEGYRGELECVIAKIFGSEAQKEVAIEYCMKTHGGRSFLHGHAFGDNVHDLLAPCIYEGEGEVLSMAFFKSLAKEHGTRFFEPIGKALAANNIRNFNPINPAHAWALRNELIPYALWFAGRQLQSNVCPDLSSIGAEFREHIEFAAQELHAASLELTQAMVKHQLKLADRQCLIADLSERVQSIIILLVTAVWAHNDGHPVVQAAAELLCQTLRLKLSCSRPDNRYYKSVCRVADQVIEKGYPGVGEIAADQILFSYVQSAKPSGRKG